MNQAPASSGVGPTELHDFRVALRRRSWLRAFKVELSDNISRKQRRRLRDMRAEARQQ